MNQTQKLLALALPDVTLVVEILPAAGRVFAHRLHTAGRRRIDRDIGPGGRYLELIDASKVCGRDLTPVRGSITEATLWRTGSKYACGLYPLDCGHELAGLSAAAQKGI
jgi:hypothetical protein